MVVVSFLSQNFTVTMLGLVMVQNYGKQYNRVVPPVSTLCINVSINSEFTRGHVHILYLFNKIYNSKSSNYRVRPKLG
jgi:hypothetical protein